VNGATVRSSTRCRTCFLESSVRGVWLTGPSHGSRTAAGDAAASDGLRGVRKQLRHAGTYISAPPIAIALMSAVRRWENAASDLHAVQIADSFVTVSANGTKSQTVPNGCKFRTRHPKRPDQQQETQDRNTLR
jgi:hypothetical protein